MTGWIDAVTAGLCLFAAYVALRLTRHTGAKAGWTFVSIAAVVMAVRRVLELLGNEDASMTWARDHTITRSLNFAIAAFLALGAWHMRAYFLSARRHEVLYRELFDGANDAAYLLDSGGRILEANERVSELLGYSRDELLGKHVATLVAGPVAGEVGDRVREVLERGETRFERVQVTKDGRQIMVEISARRISVNGTTIIHALARDLTERRAAAHKLSESEARYRELFDHASLGVYRTTPDGRVLMANPALMRILGCSSMHELEEFDLDAHATANAYDRGHFREVIERDGLVVGMEKSWKRRDGSVVHFRENARAIRDADGRTIAYEGTVEDVTERVRLEDQLVQAQKMEAVGRLAGGIAHDFNNLLTAITGYGQLLQSKLDEDDPCQKDVAQIVRAGNRASDLTRQLLAFSRKEIRQPRLVELDAILAETSPMLERLIGEDVRLTTHLSAPGVRVTVDPGQIEQVLLNLAINARDAMPQGGRLAISTSFVTLPPEDLCGFEDVQCGDCFVLSVSDTGAGMSAETLAHLYEPFFTTKAKGLGTGLGLATVYGIVKQSEGHIQVESAEGRGTTFTIYLPAKAGGARVSSPVPAHTAAPPGTAGTETILLVEDNLNVLALAFEVLSAAGYNVISAPSGPDALRAAQEVNGRIDLVLSDLVMPEMNGRELCEELWRRGLAAKVLFMSGYTDDAVARHGIIEGDVAFLHKPFTPRQLVAAVRAALDEAAAACPAA